MKPRKVWHKPKRETVHQLWIAAPLSKCVSTAFTLKASVLYLWFVLHYFQVSTNPAQWLVSKHLQISQHLERKLAVWLSFPNNLRELLSGLQACVTEALSTERWSCLGKSFTASKFTVMCVITIFVQKNRGWLDWNLQLILFTQAANWF